MTAPYAPPPPGYGPPMPVRYPHGARRPNFAGLAVAAVGGAVAIIGTLIPWYENTSLGDIVQGASHLNKDFPEAWFGWALWVVLALTAVAALFANVPGPTSTPLRIIGPLLAVAGAGGTIGALNDLVGDNGSITDHSEAGLWITLLGLLVMGVAAILGPSRSRPGPMPYLPAY